MVNSLMSHEDRLSRANEKVEEKSFQVKGESSRKGCFEYYGCRGYGSGTVEFHGRGRGYRRGRGHFGNQNRGSYGDQSQHKEAEC